MLNGSERHIRIRIGVILVADNKILLVEHFKNGRSYWLIPGGGLEYGETIVECAVRELKEETNLDISVSRFLFSSESIAPDGSKHILHMFFLGKIIGDSIKRLRVGEDPILKSAAFVDIDRLDKLEFYPPIGHIVKSLLLEGIAEQNPSSRMHLGNFWKNYPTL